MLSSPLPTVVGPTNQGAWAPSDLLSGRNIYVTANRGPAPYRLLHKERLRSLLGEQTIVRVDRLGPSKNVALGFRAFELLLERRADLVGRVRFLAFLVPGRQALEEYRSYAREMWRAAETVNRRFGREGWKPIVVFL